MSEYSANHALESAAQERARIAAILAPVSRAPRRARRPSMLARIVAMFA